MALVLARPAHSSERSTMSAATPALDVRAAFAEHGSALLGFAVNALQDRGLAEDCVQETFLRAWRARDSFDGERGSVRTWLFAIERRVILDVHRARARTPRIVAEEDAPEQATHDPDPLDRLGIVEGLARLSDAHREAVVAVHLTGLSYQELSASTGVPVATLRTRVFHALRALRTHLDEVDPRS
jgi:RNA polymerase sigma-70 factor (ECF subfamily)